MTFFGNEKILVINFSAAISGPESAEPVQKKTVSKNYPAGRRRLRLF